MSQPASDPLLEEYQALIDKKYTTGLTDDEAGRVADLDRQLDERDAEFRQEATNLLEAIAQGRNLAFIFTDAKDGTRTAQAVEVEPVLERDAGGQPLTIRWYCGHKTVVHAFAKIIYDNWAEEGIPGPELRVCEVCRAKGQTNPPIFRRVAEAAHRERGLLFFRRHGGQRTRR